VTTSTHEPAGSIRTHSGQEALRAIIADPAHTLIALDFDGTIAPIVDDPESARADPAAVEALARLSSHGSTIAVVTGRPAATAVRLGGFRQHPGLDRMLVIGQYGAERWNARTDEFHADPVPPAITQVVKELPQLLDQLGLNDVRIEHKGRAVGVHTREHEDPVGTYSQLLPRLRNLADEHGLRLEPGKLVLEIRTPDSDKGHAMRGLVDQLAPRQVVFAGDDLGDLPAFEAVAELREQGLFGLLIYSASAEEDALAERADLIAHGPGGVASWLTDLADQLDASQRLATGGR
jgi:trehalose 6-phosphate phosphatase